ncbi:INO80 complex subunit C isoform X3 [Balaenoptera musculus]|uniref:INO80 complex subunit C isoform X3 n=1 Tax=Balaenoptera musculus TaxID=9771 RepID=A0A8B8Z5H3_BALMU|nr:INO80 complex subunit C isoform X3 [Balaenoptera musculus]
MAAQIPIVATTSTPGIARNSKKRPASPFHNGSSAGGYTASKKKKVSASGFAQGISMEGVSENKMVPSDFSTGPLEKAAKPLPFKDPNFVHSGHGGAAAGKKNRTWKNLKQILASERALPWQLNDPNYFSIDAPPSFKPAKKYSDVSGLLLSALLCACFSPRPATLTPRASCASAPSKSFPTFGGCRPTWSRATWP